MGIITKFNTMENNTLNTCCFCGAKYQGYGNSTWGWWEYKGYDEKTDREKGEQCRCCDECNLKKVIKARIKLMQKVNNETNS